MGQICTIERPEGEAFGINFLSLGGHCEWQSADRISNETEPETETERYIVENQRSNSKIPREELHKKQAAPRQIPKPKQ